MPKHLSPLFTWRSAIAESDLSSTTRLVAFTLSLYMNERGGSSFPSVKTISEDSGLSRRTVQTHLSVLLDTGWLEFEDEHGRKGGKGRSTRYRAVMPKGADPAPLENPKGASVTAKGAGDAPEGVMKTGSVSQETSPAKAPRKRDPLWDVFTEELYPAVTANERGRRNAALKQIREALSDPAAGFLIAVRDVNDPSELESLWAGELRARIARYRVRFPGVACTETAIASHWSSLAGPNGRPAQPPCPECEMGGGQHAADCRRAVVERVGATVAYEEMPDPDERR